MDEPWFRDHAGRVEHQDLLNRYIGDWIARHTLAEVMEAFEREQAVVGPIYDISDIFKDPQYIARDTITTVDDPRLGRTRIQNAIPRLTLTPGRVRHLGGDLGQDNQQIAGQGAGSHRTTSWSGFGRRASWAAPRSARADAAPDGPRSRPGHDRRPTIADAVRMGRGSVLTIDCPRR